MTNDIRTIDNQIQETKSMLCVGLDPIIELLPRECTTAHSLVDAIRCFLQEIVRLTAPKACCYKIQKAFFDLLPEGHSLLRQTILYIKENFPAKTVLVDCKIGDVEHTLQAYCQNLFGNLHADGILINPYMGKEIFDMIEAYPLKTFLVLVRTSNPGAAFVQDLVLSNGRPLWLEILQLVNKSWNDTKNVIPVLSFAENSPFNRHQHLPDDMPIFWAGYGMQQKNNLTTIHSLKNTEGRGVIVNSSRGILYANYAAHNDWRQAVESNTEKAFQDLKI